MEHKKLTSLCRLCFRKKKKKTKLSINLLVASSMFVPKTCKFGAQVRSCTSAKQMSGPFSFSQGVRGSLSLVPTSLFEHLSMGQASNPPTQRTRTVRGPCSHPPLAALPPHVCHRQRDRAASIGSHTRQDMGISLAPPHLGRALCWTSSRTISLPLKPIFLQLTMVSVECGVPKVRVCGERVFDACSDKKAYLASKKLF